MELQDDCVEPEPDHPIASSDMHVEVDKDHVGQLDSEKTLNRDGCVDKVECGVKTDIQAATLRFEVEY